MSRRRRVRKIQTSIIILTRNNSPYTRRLLASIGTPDEDHEWIFVDNGSTDNTVDMIGQWFEVSRARGQIACNDYDPGGSRARNQGLSVAAGNEILFMDNDVVIPPATSLSQAITHLPSVLHRRQAVGVAPLLLFPGERYVQSAAGAVDASGRLGLSARGCELATTRLVERRVPWAPSTFLLASMTAIQAVKGFDERLDPIAQCEDIDLCCRLRDAEGDIWFTPDIRIIHFEGTTTSLQGELKQEYWNKHIRIIRRKWRRLLAECAEDIDVQWRPTAKYYESLDSAFVVPDPNNAALSYFHSPNSQPVAWRPIPRVGIIGCGRVATRGTLPNISAVHRERPAYFLEFSARPIVRVLAVSDVNPTAARVAAQACGLGESYADPSEMLDTVPLDAVFVSTTPDA